LFFTINGRHNNAVPIVVTIQSEGNVESTNGSRPNRRVAGVRRVEQFAAVGVDPIRSRAGEKNLSNLNAQSITRATAVPTEVGSATRVGVDDCFHFSGCSLSPAECAFNVLRQNRNFAGRIATARPFVARSTIDLFVVQEDNVFAFVVLITFPIRNETVTTN
jgi:hypothetical protein